MKIVGGVLAGIGFFLIASALGQDDYETYAFLHGKVLVEVMSFWELTLRMAGGAALFWAGCKILGKEGGEKDG